MPSLIVQGIRGYIEGKTPCLPILPLFHTTDGWGFVKVLSDGALTPQLCQVFNENRLYFFYGRPAYRVNSGTYATTLGAFLPVCFLVKPQGLSGIDRIYPFDTGAFANDRFENKFHPQMTLDDFALPTELDTPARLVAAFFGSNENYYHAKTLELKSLDPLEFTVEAYHAFIKDRGKTPYDDRRSSIEVQSRISVNLSRETVLAVVLPLSFLDSPVVQQIIVGEWGASLLTYKTFHMRTDEYTGQILDIVEHYLRKNSYL